MNSKVSEDLQTSIKQYKEQLEQINVALSVSEDEVEKQDLINLKADIVQLIDLTEENLEALGENEQPSTSTVSLEDEYNLFMKEMEKEGAVDSQSVKTDETDIEHDLKSLEGMKCQAPHNHSWGDTVYHNAMVCGIIAATNKLTFDEIQVRVMFTNPTHQEMLPCPYYLDGECKFADEKCRFSHGELVLLSKLQEFKEPNFTKLKVGDRILAKRSNHLWGRAIVRIHSGDECTIQFEANQEENIVPLKDVLPLDDSCEYPDESSGLESDDEEDNEWLIQKSLLTSPPSHILGEWEKHTKGIGSKLMQQMGYILGTGLGKQSDGRLEPVEAIVLPAGKSLDHCMILKENAGNDKNLFSVERRLMKIQKQQEIRNKKAYEREKNKKDVFEFLNQTILSKAKNKTKCNRHQQEIKNNSNRDLNVASLKIDEDIRRVETDLYKIRESLMRHNNPETAMNKSLKVKLNDKQEELKRLKEFSRNVSNEQNLRKDKKKMTIF